MEYLFIGGDFDGKRFCMKNGPRKIAFRRPPKYYFTAPDDPSSIKEVTMEDESYIPEIIRGKFREFVIFRHEKTGIDDMISYLIENYKKL
jgi:hypothetical protein